MGTLTLSMIVKNEEKYLKDCLESVNGVVDDIVIVDTGSTDKTLEIAKEYKAKIYHFEWINDFSAARNYALQYSSGDWILYLDADERLDPNSIKELKRLINGVSKVGYYCTVKSVDSKNERDHAIRYVRLFKNSKEIKFTGKVHEQIVPSLLENKYELHHSSILINHVGYDVDKEIKEAKAKRNLELLLNDYNENKSAYNAFQLGQTYFVLEEYDKAEEYFNVALASKELPNDLKAECYSYLAQKAHRNYDSDRAQKFMDKAIELNPRQSFYFLFISKIYLRKKDIYKAKLYAQKAMEANKSIQQHEKVNLQTIYVDPREIIYYGLNLAYQSNDNDMIEYFTRELYRIIKEEQASEKIQMIKLMESILQGREITQEIAQILFKCIDKNNLELFLMGINRQKNNSIKQDLLLKLKNKFPDNVEVIKNLASVYDNNNNTQSAVELLQNNIEIIKNDPAALFYLASFYLKINNIKKSYELFTMIEKNFSNLLDMIPKVKAIRLRLENALKS
ncbi:MAG: glycosyltransferase [Melioribacteraceae bacterium]